MNVGNIAATLSLNISNFIKNMQDALKQVRGLNNAANAAGNGAAGGMNNASAASKALGMQFKDLNRIVEGILISQAFYQSITAIKDATSAVVQFSADMEKAQIQFSYFLGSRDKAASFLEVMKDFAATTPFATDQAIRLSTQLMNAGIAADQVKGVMTILSDAASATGGTAEQMDRVVLALTQIKQQGFLAGQEVRQLGNANIPIYKILQEQLGVTGEQLKDLGNLKIPGDVAVVGILKGLKRFEGAGKEVSNTWSGMWSNIRDDALINSEKLFKGMFQGAEGAVRKLRDFMETARDALTKGGIGGLFEAIVPKELQTSIKGIVAGLQLFGQAIKTLASALWPIIKDVFGVLIVSMGQWYPIIGGITNALANMAAAALHAAPWLRVLVGAIVGLLIANVASKALMLLWSVTRVGVICAAVGQAVMVLAKSIQFLFLVATKNPIAGVLMILAGVLLYFAMSSKTVSVWLDKVTGQLASLAGVDLSQMFVPDNQKSIDDMMSEYSKQLEGMDKDVTGVGESAKKAGKKIKDTFVSSFDELYQIPDQLDKMGESFGGLGAELPKLPPLDFGGLPGAVLPGAANPFEKWKMPDWMIPGRVKPPTPPEGPGGGQPESPALPAPEISRIEKIQQAYKNALDELKKTADATIKWSQQVDEVMLKWGTSITIWVADTAVKFAMWVAETSVKFGTWVAETSAKFANWAIDTVTKFGTWAVDAGAAIGTWVTNTTLAIGTWVADTAVAVAQWAVDVGASIGTWAAEATSTVGTWVTTTFADIANWVNNTSAGFVTWVNNVNGYFVTFANEAYQTVTDWATNSWNAIGGWLDGTASSIYNWATNTLGTITTWAKGAWQTVSNLASAAGTSVGDFVGATTGAIKKATSSIGTFVDKNKSWIVPVALTAAVVGTVALTVATGGATAPLLAAEAGAIGGGTAAAGAGGAVIDMVAAAAARKAAAEAAKAAAAAAARAASNLGKVSGFEIGGIVNREQLIKIGEKNRREAVIPMENSAYMKPFSAAVANDLADMLSGNQMGGQSADTRPIMYVGTLITTGDDRAMKELYRKLNIIEIQEDKRKGLT